MIEPILITGCPRSGAEIVASIAMMCGAFSGVVPVICRETQSIDGTYENYEIRQDIVKPYFRTLKVDPLGMNPIPDLTNPELMRKMIVDGHNWWNRKIMGVMQRQGYKKGAWFYKANSMALVWPLWHSAFSNAKWIVVRRDAQEVAMSCMKTGYMRAYKSLDGWKWLVMAHDVRLIEMKRQGAHVYEVWPSKMIKDNDYSEIRMAMNWAGLTFDEEAIRNLISSMLKKEAVING